MGVWQFRHVLAGYRDNDFIGITLINRELKHRIENLFMIAGAVCRQTMRSGKSPEEMSRAAMGRLRRWRTLKIC